MRAPSVMPLMHAMLVLRSKLLTSHVLMRSDYNALISQRTPAARMALILACMAVRMLVAVGMGPVSGRTAQHLLVARHGQLCLPVVAQGLLSWRQVHWLLQLACGQGLPQHGGRESCLMRP
jgi:hypothetical protein